MSVFTKNNRFQVDNQTHYNTEDLVRLLDFIVDKEIEAKASTDRYGSWSRVPPQGALLQFMEFTGKPKYTRKTIYNKDVGHWDYTDTRQYVLPRDEKMWHVIKLVPPSSIYLNELEALSADMTKMPPAMANQLMLRVIDLCPVNITYRHVDDEAFPEGAPDLTIRIEAEKQGKRRAAVRRPEALFDLRQKEQSALADVRRYEYRLRFAADNLSVIENERIKLNLSSIDRFVPRLQAMHSELKALQEELSDIFDTTPTA